MPRAAAAAALVAAAAADVIMRCWLQPPSASPCGGGCSAPARSRAATATAALGRIGRCSTAFAHRRRRRRRHCQRPRLLRD
eukprot:2622156-Pyramimonas_sp.AAC.1